MKIINIMTNVIFDLPKAEAETIINDAPDLFKKVSKSSKTSKSTNPTNPTNPIKYKLTKPKFPKYQQNTCLPFIWEEEDDS